MDEQTAASILYGGGSAAAGSGEQPPAGNAGTETPPGGQPPAPSVAERRAALNQKREALAAEGDALTAEERQAAAAATEQPDAADVLFGDPKALATSYGPALADSIADMAALIPEVAEEREQFVQATAQAFNDAGIVPDQAATLFSWFTSALKSPPTDEQVATWTRESSEWLQSNYPDGADSRLEMVKAFIDARPKIKQLLDASGLGNHPLFVRTFIERAHQLKTPRKPRAGTS